MNEFLERLQQRKIVQWALAYLAAAFALIQVLDVVAQRFGWPGQTIRLAIIVLAIGFLATLVVAWYHGERGAQRVTSIELLILALLLTIGGAVAWRLAPSAPERIESAGKEIASASADVPPSTITTRSPCLRSAISARRTIRNIFPMVWPKRFLTH